MIYKLKGLAEGLTGKSQVTAKSIEELFEKHPVLNMVKDKLTITGTSVRGICACDG